MTLDITHTLAANSSQLNSIDLVAGPVTVQITHVAEGKDEKQPLVVTITGGLKPWLVCKAMRRVLAAPNVWGADAGKWIGRWATIYNEPTVTYGKVPEGGVRIAALSDIAAGFTVTVPDSITTADGKQKKLATYRIEKLTPPKSEMPLDTFRSWIGHALKNGWTKEQVGALLGCDKADDVPAELRAGIVATLKEAPSSDGGGK